MGKGGEDNREGNVNKTNRSRVRVEPKGGGGGRVSRKMGKNQVTESCNEITVGNTDMFSKVF